MRLVIDPSACAGHGRCYAEAPQVAEADDEGRGVAVHDVLPSELLDEAKIAAESCPEYAIRVEP
jgi:ferredoxin